MYANPGIAALFRTDYGKKFFAPTAALSGVRAPCKASGSKGRPRVLRRERFFAQRHSARSGGDSRCRKTFFPVGRAATTPRVERQRGHDKPTWPARSARA